MHRRITVLSGFMILLFAVCIFRVYYIEASDYLTAAAQVQGRYTIDIATGRGNIYDRSFRPLVNTTHRYVAAVLPTPQATAELARVLPEEERPAVLERLSGGLPFAMEVPTLDIYAIGIDVFKAPQRYCEEQLAPHLIGYLGDEGRSGAAGLERAFDEFLIDKGAKFSARYQMDASGRAMRGGSIEISRENEDEKAGIVLTIDQDIQRLTQSALLSGCEKGAAVVLDSGGDILAMASIPAFDQNNVAASLNSGDAPFINRAVSGYNIGSVFKLIVASAALESGFTQNRLYECNGQIDIGGQVFRCNNHSIHGTLDMQKALQVSCNTYFISLAQQLDPKYLISLCRLLGLGSSQELAPGLTTRPGNLPTPQELSGPAALANFSFGQGSSLASPLQIAQAVGAIIGGGVSTTPRLIKGFTYGGENISEPYPRYAGGEVLSAETAQTMQRLMIGVIRDGSGRTANPLQGGAGGKTSSAQTGLYITVEDGEEKEIVHAWFAGFYPAENPRYCIVVFVEGGESGERIAAPIFKQIADGICALETRTDS